VAAVACTLIAPYSAQASIQIQAGDYIWMTRGPGGYGGVFNTQETNSNHSAVFGDVFPTFCVEVSEHISLPGKYYVDSLGSTALNSGNVLTDLAGWIYADYLDGTLTNQALWSQNPTKFNNSVQVAIWYEVLNHTISIATLGSTYIQGGTSNYDPVWVNSILTTTAHPNSNHGVQIMNLLTSPTGGIAQDQLVRNAPEAASLVVWSLLVSCGMVVVGRKR
jgi:hypothetical protein